MSDEETPVVDVEETEEAGTSAPTQMNLEDATKEVLKNALVRDGLQRGLRQAAKALDSKRAQLCFLASNCSEDAYKDLINALCKEHGIPLLTVPEAKVLGEWSGLCKIDAEGNARKVVSCSCVAITNWGKQGEGYEFVQEHLKSNQ
mgnify:CR=1 FL=1